MLTMDNNKENIVRVGPSSDIHFKSTKPVELEMLYGDIFSKLHALPNGEKYSVQTPLGLASVRGSIYQVVHRNITQVFNFDESLVTFESFDENSKVTGKTTISKHLSLTRANIRTKHKPLVRISPQQIEWADSITLFITPNTTTPVTGTTTSTTPSVDQASTVGQVDLGRDSILESTTGGSDALTDPGSGFLLDAERDSGASPDPGGSGGGAFSESTIDSGAYGAEQINSLSGVHIDSGGGADNSPESDGGAITLSDERATTIDPATNESIE